MEYVVAAANLYGQIYGVNGTRDFASIRSILEEVHVPAFTPKSSVKIHVTDKEMEEEKEKESGDAGESFQLADTECNDLAVFQGFFSLPSLCLCTRKSPTGGAERKAGLTVSEKRSHADVPHRL